MSSSSLIDKFKEDLILAGKSERTQKNYLWPINTFARFCGCPPEQATEKQVREYFVYLVKEKEAKATTLRVHQAALRFLFERTLRRPMPVFSLIKPQSTETLPVVLSRQEIKTLVSLTHKPVMKTLLLVIYSCGLRVEEAVSLKTRDIDSHRMLLWVRKGKGKRDRRVPLPKKTLQHLRDYYRECRPKGDYLFPGNVPTRHRDKSTLQKAFIKVKKESGIEKPVTLHSLRHAYATHLLDDGVSLRALQQFLGHKNIKVTVRYAHLTELRLSREQAVIDDVMDTLL